MTDSGSIALLAFDENATQVQVPTHRATCFAAQVVFVLGASVQPLRQSGTMPRPAPMDSDVEDGSPTTASKEFEAVCFKRS